MDNILFKLSDVYNKEKVSIPQNESEEEIIGKVILNRIVGIAYDNIDMFSLNKECKKSLAIIKREHEKQFDTFIFKLKYLTSILANVSFDYAFLKGAFLTPALYKRGQRTSNDIDILVNASDITYIQALLLDNGFIQGHCDEYGNIVPASRREIIDAKMNYGETVPFLRYLDNELLEIDLNFSVDFKSKGNTDIVSELLHNSRYVNTHYCTIKTLSNIDFLIHLCCHLFKEATTYDWVLNRRDLMIYKFSDINVYLHECQQENYFQRLSKRIIRFGVEKACYYTLLNASIIYPDLKLINGFTELLQEIKPNSLDYLQQIVYPKKKKVYTYNVSFVEWFEAQNRLNLLQEI